MSSQVKVVADAVANVINQRLQPLVTTVQSLRADVEALKAQLRESREEQIKPILEALFRVRLEEAATTVAAAAVGALQQRIDVLEAQLGEFRSLLQELAQTLKSLDNRLQSLISVSSSQATRELGAYVVRLEQAINKFGLYTHNVGEEVKNATRSAVMEALSQAKIEVPKELVDVLKGIIETNKSILERLQRLEEQLTAMQATESLLEEFQLKESEEEEKGREGQEERRRRKG